MKGHIKGWHLAIIFVLFSLLEGHTQNNSLRVWLSQNVRVRLDKGIYFNLNYFQNFHNNRFTYTQFGGSISRRIGKNVNLSTGFLQSKSLTRNRKGSRISIGLSYSAKKHPFQHSLKIEYFYPKTSKYSVRWSYRLRTSHAFVIQKMRCSFYSDAQIFYFLGGKERWLYDEVGDKIQKNAPYGFHRLRVRGGLIFKPWKILFFQTGLLWQQEFNLLHHSKGRINTINPNSGKVKYAFSNYPVLFLGIQWRFYTKQKRKPPIPKNNSPYFDYFHFNHF